MASSMALASIFGPILVITGLWTLLYKDSLKKVLDSLKKTPALLYFVSVINILIGMVFVTSFNYWYWNVEVLVTILGWFFLARGLLVLYFPKSLDKMIKMYANAPVFSSLVSIAWGLVLSWFALGN